MFVAVVTMISIICDNSSGDSFFCGVSVLIAIVVGVDIVTVIATTMLLVCSCYACYSYCYAHVFYGPGVLMQRRTPGRSSLLLGAPYNKHF